LFGEIEGDALRFRIVGDNASPEGDLVWARHDESPHECVRVCVMRERRRRLQMPESLREAVFDAVISGSGSSAPRTRDI
jgi:hypothetical protein